MEIEAALDGRTVTGDSVVFCTKSGTFIGKSNLRQRSYLPLLAAAKVPPIRFHDLRHIHATLQKKAGVDLKDISARLGHSQIGITANLYQHADDEADKAASSKFVTYLYPVKDVGRAAIQIGYTGGYMAVV